MQILICWTDCQPDWNAWAAIGSVAAAAATYYAIHVTLRLNNQARDDSRHRMEIAAMAAEKKHREEREEVFADCKKFSIRMCFPLASMLGRISAAKDLIDIYASYDVIPNQLIDRLRLDHVEEIESLIGTCPSLNSKMAGELLWIVVMGKAHNARVRLPVQKTFSQAEFKADYLTCQADLLDLYARGQAMMSTLHALASWNAEPSS